MPAHPLGSANTQRERYICLICNIGSGQEKRSYNRRFSNNESPEAKFYFNTSHLPNMPKLYKNEFQIPSAFNKHLTGWHARVFQSINSSEYICSLCPCDCVMGRTLVCSARYPADSSEAKQRFLDHLRGAHAQTPENLVWYPHQCPPAMKEYYTNPEVRKVAESIP